MRTHRIRDARSPGAAGSVLVLLIAATSLSITATPASAQSRLPPQLDGAQAAAASALPNVKAIHADAKGTPVFIEADLGSFRATDRTQAEDTAALLRRLRPLLRGDGTEALRARKSNADGQRGLRHHRMTQTIDGLEVIGGEAILHVDSATSKITSMDMQFLSGAGLPRTPSFSAADAMRNALVDAQISAPTYVSQPRLAFRRMPDGSGHLVWVARIRHTDARRGTLEEDILASATSGRLLERMPLVHEVLNRNIYDYPSGILLVSEGGSTGDTAASNVYQFAGEFYNYFSGTYGRDSWNGAGASMTAYVHGTPVGQNNATFNCGTGTAYFGDGDGALFGPLSASRDIVAHEWTHGLTCSEANLTYSGESGALNESMSDIFGAAVEGWVTGVTSNTWLAGEAAYTPGVGGDALRYMHNPTADTVSRDYYPDLQPFDDVHYGSGIGNLAFYLLASGGSHPRGLTAVTVSGIGIAKASRIFYLALRDYLMSSSNYSAARDTTARVAREQYGVGSAEHVSTCKAWDAVNVPNSGTYCPGTSGTLTQGTFSFFGQTTRGLNLAIPIGSMSPGSTFNGKTFRAFADVAPQQTSFVRFSGFSADPGASWLVSATAFGVTRFGVNATYTYSNGEATWGWPSGSTFGFTGSGATTVTVVHGP